MSGSLSELFGCPYLMMCYLEAFPENVANIKASSGRCGPSANKKVMSVATKDCT